MPEKTLKGWNCTISEMAEITGLTRKTIHDAILSGCPVVKQGKTGKGNATIINMNDYLRWRNTKQAIREKAGPKGDGNSDDANPRNRIAETKASIIELQLAEKRGDLFHFKDLMPYLKDKMVIFRQAGATLIEDVRDRFNNKEIGDFVEKKVIAMMNNLANGMNNSSKEMIDED